METLVVKPLEMEKPRTISAARSQGHRIELQQYLDGTLVITLDGAEEVIYRVGTCNLESCVKSYLALLRS